MNQNKNTRKLKILALSLSILSFASACSLKKDDDSRVRVSFPGQSNRSSMSSSLLSSALLGRPGSTGLVGLPSPLTLDDFTCFGINVTGPEITANPAFSSCSNPNLPYVGVVGGLAPIISGSVEVVVPSGVGRTFQLFTVQSQNTIGCPAMDDSVIAKFGSADIGNAVEVGRTTADILGDTSVNIFASFDPNNPKPMFCSNGAGVPTKLAVIGPSTAMAGVCQAFNVELQDANGNPVSNSYSLALTLSGAGAGSFYTSGSCASSTSTVSLAANATSAPVYFMTPAAASVTLQASGSGLTAGTLPVTTSLPILAFQTVPSAENAASVFTIQPVVQVRDSLSAVMTGMTPTITLQAFSGPACSGTPAGSFSGTLSVVAVAGIATYSGLSWSTSENIYIKASATGMTPACSPVFVVSPPPATIPVIAYTGSPFSFTDGVAISTLTPSNSGGAIVSCAVAPALPSGLSLNSATCAISGTPVGVSTATGYSITATNGSGASSPAVINIAVNAVPPATLSYSSGPTIAYTQGSAITSNNPTSSGGTVVSYSIAPALPSGLTLNTSTGVISGTPSSLSSPTGYTVTATNTGGSTPYAINIAVNAVPPSALSYTVGAPTYTVGTAISANSPTASGGAVVSYSISAPLPTGLSFNTSTGVISGTPTVYSVSTPYTVTATNSGGSTNVVLNVTVVDIAPSSLAYSSPTAAYTYNVAITNNSPTSSGGAVTSYSIAPTLPSGLSLNAATGVISGTPTVLSGNTPYTVTATNSGGNTTAVVNISVVDVAPNTLAYSTASPTYTVGSAITNNTPSSLGGAVASYTVAPALPSGLVLNGTTGVISGTPTAVSSSTAYTVTATNTGGNTTAVLNITVAAGSAYQLAFITQPSTTGTAGTPLAASPVVQVQDASANPVTSSTLKIRLTAFADAGCTEWATPNAGIVSNISATANPVAAVSGQATFSNVQYSNPGTVYLKAEGGNLLPACSGPVALGGSGPQLLAFVGSNTFQTGVCSGEIQVRSLDTTQERSAMGGALTVNLSGAGAGTFYLNPNCTSPTTSISIAGGDSSASFYYQSPSVGMTTFSANAAGMQTATRQVTTVSNWTDPSKLETDTPMGFSVGECAPMSVTRIANGSGFTPASPGYSTTVNLSTDGPAQFYSDAGCTAVITSVVIASGTSAATFYAKSLTAGMSNLFVQDAGNLMTSHPNFIGVAAAGAPVYTGLMSDVHDDVRTFSAQGCLGIGVFALTQNFDFATVGSPLTTNLGGAGLNFFSDNNCVTTSWTATFATGTGAVMVRFAGMTTGPYTASIDGSGSGLPLILANFSLSSPVPRRFDFSSGTSPTSFTPNTCYPITVQAKSDAGSLVAMGYPTNVTLSSGGGGSFYSDAGCTTSIGGITFAPADDHKDVYFKAASGSGSFYASSPAAYSYGLSWSVGGGGGSHYLSFNGPLTFDNNSGTCAGPYTIQTMDGPVGSPVNINLTGASFWQNPGCATSISTTTISSGSQSPSFYVSTAGRGILSLFAHDTGGSPYGDAHLDLIVTNSAVSATNLAFDTTNTMNSGPCYAVNVYSTDGSLPASLHGAWSPTLSVSTTGSASAQWSSSSSCSGLSPTLPISFASNQDNAVAFIQVSGTGTVTLLSSSPSGSSASITVSGGGGSNGLGIIYLGSVAPMTFNATPGVCQGPFYVGQLTAGAMGPASSTITNIGAGRSTGTGMFYADTDTSCTGSSSSVYNGMTVNNGTNQSSLGFRYMTSTNDTIYVHSTDFPAIPDGNMNVSVSGGSNHFNINGPTTPTVGCLGPYWVESKDGSNNPMSMTGSNKLVNLAGAAYHSNSGCSASISSVTILNGSSSSGNFWINQVSPTTLNLSATDNGGGGASFNPGSLTVTVSSGGGALAFSGVPGTFSPSTCVGPYYVTAPSATTGNVIVSIGGGLSLSGSGACSAPSSSMNVSFSASTMSNTFWVSVPASPSAGSINASNSTLNTSPSPGSQGFSIGGGGGATQFMLGLGSTEVAPSGCAGPYQVTAKDNSYTTVNVSSPVTVNVSADFGQIYNSGTCATTLSSVTINPGTSVSSSSFWFKAGSAHIVHITAHDQASVLFDRVESLLVTAAGPATAMQFDGSANFNTGNCQQFRIVSTTATDTPAPVNTLKTVSFSDGAMGGIFYSDGACTLSTSTVNISSGTSSQWIFYKNTSPGNYTLNATAGGLTAANLPVCVGGSCGPNLGLRFMPGASFSALASASSGIPITIQSVNAGGTLTNVGSNVTVNLNSFGNGGFYLNSNCTSPVSSVTINSGSYSNSVPAYFCDSTARFDEIMATAVGYQSAQTVFGMAQNGTATTWVIKGKSVQATSSCQGYLIFATNGGGLPIADASNPWTTLSLSAPSLGGDTGLGNPFAGNEYCSGNLPSIGPNPGSAGADFYVLTSAVSGSTFITAAAGTLTTGVSFPIVTGGAGQPAALAFDPSASLPTSGCTNVNIGIFDATYTMISGGANTGTGSIQLDAVDPSTGGQLSGVGFWDGGCGGSNLGTVPSVTPMSGISSGNAGKVIGIDKAGHPNVKVKMSVSGSPPPLGAAEQRY